MKILIGIGLTFATILIWTFVDQYFFCPRFVFSEPHAFNGPRLYNPYQEADSSRWIMGNLHAHSHTWMGLTNGEGTPHEISKAYDSLGYKIHLVSDYHKIDFTYDYKKSFIPAYEHGYNIKKTHYLVLNDSSVHWKDFLFRQLTSNKQQTLNELSRQGTLVVINHPGLRNGFTNDDMKYLNGYQYIEALSPYSNSIAKWDVALSSGKPIFICANDDVHNIHQQQSLGRFCTWVNADSLHRDRVMASLRKGESYGMKISESKTESFDEKKKRFKTRLPRLVSLKIQRNVMQVRFNMPATIIFSGQDGIELAQTQQSKASSYSIKDVDTYVRTTAIFADGTTIYLNPVFRYADQPLEVNEPVIDRSKSAFLGVVGSLLLMVWGLFLIRIVTRMSAKRRLAFR